MALKKVSRTDKEVGVTQRLGWLAVSAVDEVSTFYAIMARILIGRIEDFSDLEAARRSRRLNLAAAKRAGGAKTLRLRS